MSGPCYRVFVNTRARREESGHEIESRIGRPARDDYPSYRQHRQSFEVGGKLPQLGFGLYFHEVVKLILADVFGGSSERFEESGRSLGWFFGFQGEIEFDVVSVASGFQDAALGREADFLAGGLALLPENMRRRQGCMAAQVHFDARREPAQIKMIRLFDQIGRLREIHVPGHGLQPAIVFPFGKKADGGGIARERAVGEGVNVEEGNGHT